MLIIRCLGVQAPASPTGFAAHKPPHGRHALLLLASLLAVLGTCKCPVAELAALAAMSAGLRHVLGGALTRSIGLSLPSMALDCCVAVRPTTC